MESVDMRKGGSGEFTSGTQHGNTQGRGDPEAGFELQTVQQGFHGRDQRPLASLDQNAEQSHGRQVHRGGRSTLLRLIHEHQISP